MGLDAGIPEEYDSGPVEEPRMDMDWLGQRIECSLPQYRPYLSGFTTFLGLSFLFLFAGCAQLDQLMGREAASPESQSTAQDKESTAKQATKKKADESPPVVEKEPSQRALSSPAIKQTDQEKALAEKKEKKSHVASDKKPKKPQKPQAESQSPTEDVFLSPVPLPSKPAAIGGSGG